jgi:hypothetical protein
VDVETGDVLFWSLSGSTWRRQGSVISYVDPIAELLVNNQARVSAIGGGDPCRQDDNMRRYFFCYESYQNTK